MIIQKIHHSQDVLDVKWTEYIADQLNYDYKYSWYAIFISGDHYPLAIYHLPKSKAYKRTND